jgi:hypothetical protein
MKVYVHKLVVDVVTLDPNPASVARTIDSALTDLKVAHPKGRILVVDCNPAGNESREVLLPDEPYGGEPDTLEEIHRHDEWMNNFVYEALRS